MAKTKTQSPKTQSTENDTDKNNAKNNATEYTRGERRGRGYEIGGVAFAGCIMLGLGIGMAIGKAGAGIILGTGIGFLAMAMFRYAVLNRLPQQK